MRSAAKPSGNDPLAELARLIGQTDPFAEFGREQRAPRGCATAGRAQRLEHAAARISLCVTSGAAPRAPAAPPKRGMATFLRGRSLLSSLIGAPQSYAGQNSGANRYAGAPAAW